MARMNQPVFGHISPSRRALALVLMATGLVWGTGPCPALLRVRPFLQLQSGEAAGLRRQRHHRFGLLAPPRQSLLPTPYATYCN